MNAPNIRRDVVATALQKELLDAMRFGVGTAILAQRLRELGRPIPFVSTSNLWFAFKCGPLVRVFAHIIRKAWKLMKISRELDAQEALGAGEATETLPEVEPALDLAPTASRARQLQLPPQTNALQQEIDALHADLTAAASDSDSAPAGASEPNMQAQAQAKARVQAAVARGYGPSFGVSEVQGVAMNIGMGLAFGALGGVFNALALKRFGVI